MSSGKRLIINCGASHITAAVFSGSDGIVLEDLRTQQLDYDFSHEDQWLYAVGAGLREICKDSRFRGPATIIAPGYLLLTKTIKVPHVEESRQAQVFAFEAQQNIPYPLKEVVWDYQVIADDGIETEVALIAVKAETMHNFCRMVGSLGIQPVAIQAASILDYNAYQFCYSDTTSESLIINIGARSANLVFVGENGFFVRNISLGGNSLTQTLADNLGKPFAQAESIKTAFFSGQTSFSEDDSATQIIRTNAQAFTKRLSQEVTRSIVNYRRQKGGKAPQRILLTGRGALLQGLSEQLAETQKVDVEYFDPLKGITLGTGVAEDDIPYLRQVVSELVGEACRTAIPNPVGINLLPAEISKEQQFNSKRVFIVGAAVVAVLALIPPLLYQVQAETVYKDQREQIERRLRPLRAFEAKIQDEQQVAEQIRGSISQIEGLVNSKSNWINFFSDLQERLVALEDVWLETLTVDRSAPTVDVSANGEQAEVTRGTAYRLRLSGRLLLRDFDPNNPGALDPRQASARVNALLERFTESEFIEAVESVQFDTSDRRILRFNFTLVVDQDKPL